MRRSGFSAVLSWLRYRPDHVVAAIGGGLGNQLFQFATGRALSLRLRLPLKLDYSDQRDCWERNGNELEAFNLKHARLTEHEREQWLGPGSTLWTQRHVCRWTDQLLLHRRVVERPHESDDPLARLDRPAFLAGLWQSELFFKDQGAVIRAELLAGAPSCAGSRFYEQLSAPDSVAVHIRRKDYLNAGIRQVMGLCGLSYYERAVRLLRSRVVSPRFYLFSDDPDWVRAEPRLAELGPVISPDTSLPARDLILMSRCRHFVTANSSFSWWAAWLGQRADSIVINPAPWFFSAPTAQKWITPSNWIAFPKN